MALASLNGGVSSRVIDRSSAPRKDRGPYKILGL